MRSRECCDTPNGCTPETRDLVRRIVNEIGYVTNRLARTLRVGCSGPLLGATVLTLRHSLFADTIEGMTATDALAEAGIP